MQPSTAEQAQYNKMTQTPIPKLLVTLAVPTVISMMTTAIYNMADTAFVSVSYTHLDVYKRPALNTSKTKT